MGCLLHNLRNIVDRGLQCDQPPDKQQRKLLAPHHQAQCIPGGRHMCDMVYAEPQVAPYKEVDIPFLLGRTDRTHLGTGKQFTNKRKCTLDKRVRPVHNTAYGVCQDGTHNGNGKNFVRLPDRGRNGRCCTQGDCEVQHIPHSHYP